MYTHARVLSWTDTAIDIEFADEVLAEIAKDKVGDLQAVLKDLHHGRVVEVRIKVGAAAPGASRSVAEDTRVRAAEERRSREAEARAHPATKMVLETFGASIKEIKTDV
jgi:hypothetical protein